MVNFKPCFIFKGQIYAHQFLFSASGTHFFWPGAAKMQEWTTKKIWSLPLRGSWAFLSFYRRYRHPWHPKHFIYCTYKQVWVSPALMLIDRKGGIFFRECCCFDIWCLFLVRFFLGWFFWSWWSSFMVVIFGGYHLVVILQTIVAHH